MHIVLQTNKLAKIILVIVRLTSIALHGDKISSKQMFWLQQLANALEVMNFDRKLIRIPKNIYNVDGQLFYAD